MSIRLVSLDMAGTTIDEGGVVYELVQETIEGELSRPVPADVLARWTGTSKREAIEGILAEMDGDVARADVLFQEFLVRLAEAYSREAPTALPGVGEAIIELRRNGVAVVLQTGYTREVAESLLDAVGWAVGRDIDGLVTSDEVAASRPAPYLVFRSMEVAGVHSVDEVLVAGDTPNDLGAGINAGARLVVGVLTGAATAEELGRHRHTHILGSVAGLPDLLAGSV
ncbi:phosphonatase-like hydrolase [Rathayibacter sp. YIM 133350]|uniref:phosphonatase-like hydrolase n=1 Tax=Rathayibacter sp. YIM 133350 TaxID=3131992 RepID=UPI00307E0AB9